MADIAIFRINYKSDFVLTINSDAGWAVPFCIKFWTSMPSQGYFVGYNGSTYTNCRIGDDPTKLLVMFDDHHMPIGELKMQIAYHTTIEEFPDRKFDEVTNPTNVTVDIDETEYQVMLDFTGESGAEIDFSMPSSGVMSVNGKIGYVTLNAEDVGAQPTIEDLATIRSGAAEGATAVQPDEMTAALATKQDTISDLSEIRRGAALGSTAVRPSELQQGLSTKQDTISDLATIRSGAAAGATAVQPAELQEGLAEKQDTISDLSTIRNGAAAGATAVQPAGLTPIQTALQTIEAVIPSAASSQNQLADKNFVNSSISTNTANFVGTYNSLAELQAVQNPTNNDYGFVIETDAQGNEYYDRYKYVASSQQWLFEYKVESTPFTAAQWAAIQSGITSALVTKLNALPTNAELQQTLDGKADAADIPTALSQLSQDSTHRTVTDAEKSTWNGKQNAISDLATIRSGAAAGATAVQPAAMNAALATKQDTLTFDNTPTANSNNPVKSGGIKTALDAKQSTISTVNVTVDNNTGTPSGSASVSGSTLSLSFQNLKGATGATGATGPQGPQGERGLPGESGVTGDVSGFTVIQTIDPSATYGATDIAGAATVQATNQELTELEGELGESVTIKGSELFDINTTSAEAASSYITASVDTANDSVSFTTTTKSNTVFALRIKLPNLTIGAKYRLKFDYTNGINTISSVVIKNSANSSTLYRFSNTELPTGSGNFEEDFICPAGAYFLAFNVNLNVSTGRVATFSNISVFAVDTIKEEIAKIEDTFNNTFNDVWPSIGRRMYKPDPNVWIDGYAITAETGTPTANSGCSYCKVMLEGVDRIDVPMRQSTALTYGLTFFSSSGVVTGYHSESTATGTRFTYDVPDNTSYMLYQYSISVKTDVYMIFYYDDFLEQSSNAIVVRNVPMEVGMIASSGNLLGYNSRTDYQWNCYRNAGFIKVKEGIYSITCSNKGGTIRIFKYGSDRRYLSYTEETITSGTPIQVSIDCKYIRLAISNATDTFMPEVTISGDLDDNCFVKFGINPQTSGSTLENFLVETWYQTMGSDNDSTTNVQDEGELLKNRGLIQLPDNYDPDGKPTRLVIYCHGSGVVASSGDDIGSPFTSSTTAFDSSSTGHVDPTVFLKEGYAVMDMDSKLYTNAVLSSTNKDCPTPRVINCYKSGYDYVLRNYNICKDGVMLCGRSMGGVRVVQLLLSDIPVIACCLVGPYVGPSYIWNVAGRGDFLGELNGFPSNLTWDTTAPYMTYDEWHTNIYDNYGKFMNSVGLLRAMNIPDKDSLFEETIEDGVVTSGFRMERTGSGAAVYNSWDEEVFEKWGAKYPCPIKIFLATDDSTAPWRSHGNVLYKCCEAGGTPVELRKFTSGGHFPEFEHKASSYTTRFGETLSDVSVVYIEMIRFFRRYEQ